MVMNDTSDTPGPWLTAIEAFRYLGFPSRKSLYQAVRRGQIPAHRLGRRLRFRAADLDSAFLAERARNAQR